jgi:hypothetical protein
LKEKITTAIAEMVVKDYLPLSFAEGDVFFYPDVPIIVK